jgi:hypothetical protein
VLEVNPAQHHPERYPLTRTTFVVVEVGLIVP